MFDFLFTPLLIMDPIMVVMIFAIIILLIINLLQKLLVNQREAKELKESVRELGKRMKEEQKEGNTEKANELMKEMMGKNSKMMSMTMKPMLVSFIIVILFFPWLANTYGDKVIALEDDKGNVTLGNDLYSVQLDGDKINVIKDGATIISSTSPAREKIGDILYVISHEKEGCLLFFCHPENIKLARVVAQTPIPVPVFPSMESIIVINKREFGWLGWYLIISIPMAIIIRKALKINV